MSHPNCPWGLTAQSHCSKGDPSSRADPWTGIHARTCWGNRASPGWARYSLKQHTRVPGAHPKGHSPWQLNLGLASDPLENKGGKQSNEGGRTGTNHSTRKSGACQESQSREGNTEPRQEQQWDQAPNTSQFSHEQPHFIQERPNSLPDHFSTPVGRRVIHSRAVDPKGSRIWKTSGVHRPEPLP